MEFIFIDQHSEYYKEAIDLRVSLFFSGMNNAKNLINDTHENQGQHLVCLEGEEIVGTGRLNIEKKTGDYFSNGNKKRISEKRNWFRNTIKTIG